VFLHGKLYRIERYTVRHHTIFVVASHGVLFPHKSIRPVLLSPEKLPGLKFGVETSNPKEIEEKVKAIAKKAFK
jgi:hypothetical protein